MAVGAYTFYNSFRKKIGKKIIDLSADSFLVALFKSTSNAATLTLSTLGSVTNEISATGGYAAHGRALVNRIWTVGASAKQFKFGGSAPIFTAVAASLNNIKFAVIHDNTVGASAGLRPLVCFVQLSTAQFTISTGNTMTILNPATGIFTLA
jgi:hypothetical protein